MKLYEIVLPVADNSGCSYAPQLDLWELRAAHMAGGFTRCAVASGNWRDPSDGKVYEEAVVPYRIACSSDVFEELIGAAFAIFPDQRCIFTTIVGEARLIDNVALSA